MATRNTKALHVSTCRDLAEGLEYAYKCFAYKKKGSPKTASQNKMRKNILQAQVFVV